MKKTISRHAVLFLFLLFSFALNAQQNNQPKEKIAGYISKYFEMDRENIHVHFDKTLFFTDESVWFKGYVFNRKAGVPFYTTTNVHMQLIDASGAVVSNQVLYVINGLFSGKLKLNAKFASGHYYLQFYTNWMNNFTEDESFIQKIKIINPDDNSIPVLDLPNKSRINLAFFPEGGNLIGGISNNIGAIVTDTNGMPLPNSSFTIMDSSGQTIRTVTTNSQGMGKFEITPDGSPFKGVVSDKNTIWEYPLPSPQPGIALEVNNYAVEGKTFIKVKPSKEYLSQLQNMPLYLVIQQDEKCNIIEITLSPDNVNKEIAFTNDNLFKGINTIRIIDAAMNQLAERYIYENPGYDPKLNIGVGFKNDDRIDLSGNCNSFEACLSIAVLPGNSLLDTQNNMLSNLYLNPYLSEKVNAKRENFSNTNRNKKFEMDLLALNQNKNKYSWEAIKSMPPTAKYEFESGIQIKGIVNIPSSGLKRYKVELRTALNEILGRSEVNEKNEFYFNDTNVTDSLMVYCDLIHMDNLTKKDMSYHLMVTNSYKRFNKNYVPARHLFPENDGQGIAINEIPKFDGKTIFLDEVEIKNKTTLKRQNHSGNSFLRGTKISEHGFENMTVLDFIQSNGFYVSNYLGNVIISAKIPTSINATPQTVPLVFIDGRQLMSFDELFGMRMEELDEIYLSTRAIVASINNNNGIIKMYRKFPDYKKQAKEKSSTIIGGFEPITSFTNADYLSVYSTGFENFGVVNWVPWVITDANGNLRISIDNKKHKKVRAVIEGFTIDGKLVSEIREINLQE